jgi:peptide/nickel transport system substrate-binding protein
VCRWFATSSLITGLLLASVCASEARIRPHYGGTLHVDTQGDPWQGRDSIGRRMVFDSLTRIDNSGVVVPALALRWQSQNADHRWQFWLRPGVRFHDGSLLTADSVVQSLTRSCTQCPWTAVRPLGDSVVFTMASSDPVLPAEVARSLYAIARQDASGDLVGTGAFRFVSQSNGLLSLAAVDDAWQGRPFVDAVEINGGRGVRNQWLDMSSGRADVVELPVENLHQAQQEHLAVVESGACDLLVLSVARTGVLQDDAQREAVALAVDRGALYNVIFQKQGEMTASLLPNALTGYAFLFPKERDLARAQASRGGANGAPLTLTVEGASAVVQLAAERIALNLREAGFRVQVVPHSSSAAADFSLKMIHLESVDARVALRQILGAFNQVDQFPAEESNNPASLYREEAGFLQTHQAVPLLYLPRAYAVGPRAHGLELSADGIPLLDDVSVEDGK